MSRSSDARHRRARPEGIVTTQEWGRVGDFILLFEEQLSRVASDPDRPSTIEVFVARRQAQTIWTFDRMTNDGVCAERLARAVSTEQSWAEWMRSHEFRLRATRALTEELEAAEELLASFRLEPKALREAV